MIKNLSASRTGFFQPVSENLCFFSPLLISLPHKRHYEDTVILLFSGLNKDVDSSITFINNDFPQMFYFKCDILEIADTIKTWTVKYWNKWKYTWKRNQHRVINIRLKIFFILCTLISFAYYNGILFPLTFRILYSFHIKKSSFCIF